MRRLQLFYALVSSLWLAYYVRSFLAIPVALRNPHVVSSFFFCLLLVVILPVGLGYLLLFRLAPWITRRLTPAR
jgi:hypothetical protein